MRNVTDDRDDSDKDRKREVLTRFTPSELDAMRRDTGADADATAVASFVRKRLDDSADAD